MKRQHASFRMTAEASSAFTPRVVFIVVVSVAAIATSAALLLRSQRQSVLARAATDSLRLARGIAGTQERFLNDTSQLLGFFRQSADTANPFSCAELARELITENNSYANVGAVWPDGTVYCSAEPGFEGVQLGGADFFVRAAANRGATVAFPRTPLLTDQAVAVVFSPIFDERGDLRAMLFAAPKLDWINAAHALAGLPEGSAVGILDEHGDGLVRVKGADERVVRDLSRVFSEKGILTRGEGIARETEEGGDRFIAVKSLESGSGEPAGYAYVDVPFSELAAFGTKVTSRNLFLLGLAAVAAFLISLGIAQVTIMRDLRKIVSRARRIAAGDVRALKSARSKDAPGLGAGALVALDAMETALAARESVAARRLEALETELNHTIESDKRKNADLEDVKRAMMNLLEDLDVDRRLVTQEKAKAEALLAAVGDGIVAMDAQATITYVNGLCVELLGFSKNELIGADYFTKMRMVDEQGRDVPRHLRPIARAMRTKARVEATITQKFGFIRADRSVLPIAAVAMPLTENGSTSGALMIFRDVTHEREVDRAKSEFVSVASHQLRTAPTAIRWYAEMLLSGEVGKLAPKQKKIVSDIHLSSVRMIELIGALLNVSRIELGMYAVVPEPVDAVKFAKEVLEDMAHDVKEKHLFVDVVRSKDFGTIIADARLMRIILQNLLSNAIKYTPQGGRVMVRFSVEGDGARIDVSDTGVGIPKEQQPMVFTKFFRASNITSIQGSGLGLYIVKSMCKYAGCRLWFASEPGKGTTFTLTIPRDGMRAKEGEHALFDILTSLSAVHKIAEKSQ